MAGFVQDEWAFRLTLIRHGETNENRDKIIQGQDNTVLNETGKEQTERLGTKFKYEHLTRIYSSDLDRAIKTAEGICLRNVHFKNLKIFMDSSLRERNYGEAEGKSRQELKKILSSGRLPRGAETEKQVQKRAVDFFTKLLEDISDLRKSLQSTIDTSDSSLEEQEFEECDLHSKSDSCIGDGIRSVSHGDPSSDKSLRSKDDSLLPSDTKYRTSSYPVTTQNRKLLRPVLLKDLCFDLDNASDCDHTDKPIYVVVVSHGGIIRHFVSYFAKNFDSQFPVDKRKLLRQICPNTGVSEFAVMMNGRAVANIDCLKLYDRTHLT